MKHADRNDKTTESKRIQGRNQSLRYYCVEVYSDQFLLLIPCMSRIPILNSVMWRVLFRGGI